MVTLHYSCCICSSALKEKDVFISLFFLAFLFSFFFFFILCDANGDIKGNERNGMSNLLALFSVAVSRGQ